MEYLAMSGTTRSQRSAGPESLDLNSEARWINQAQQGDMNSFNRLVSAYQERVYRFAYRVLGDSEAAGDATQQAFVTAHRHLNSFRGNSLRLWLMSCTIRSCRERSIRRQPLNLRRSPPDPVRPIAQGYDCERSRAVADHHALDQIVQLGLATLGFDDRITLVLADMESYSYEEIAAISATRIDAVRSRLSDARIQMTRFLATRADQVPATYRLAES